METTFSYEDPSDFHLIQGWADSIGCTTEELIQRLLRTSIQESYERGLIPRSALMHQQKQLSNQ